MFLDTLEQRTRALGGDELTTAANGVDYIKSQFELLALASQGPLEQRFEPPLAKASYTLDELLGLRSQWRELVGSATQLELQIEQSERKSGLLQDRRDKLLRDYASADPESPSRIIAGINRVSARVEYELARASTENFRTTLKQIETQGLLLNEQQVFAKAHLVSTDVTFSRLAKGKQRRKRKRSPKWPEKWRPCNRNY